MIGDLFSTGSGSYVTVQAPVYTVTPTSILATFTGQTESLVTSPTGGNPGESTFFLNGAGFYEVNVNAGVLNGTSFNPNINGPLTQGGAVSTPYSGFVFTSLNNSSTIGDLSNGDQVQLDNGGAFANTLQSFYLATKPGLQAQANAFALLNSHTGTGVFTSISGESVQVQGATAEQTVEGSPALDDPDTSTIDNTIADNGVGLAPDQFLVQQDVLYAPGQWLFTPSAYQETPPEYQIYVPTGGSDIAAAPGANVGRLKLTENTSPLPRDRVYVNYSYFDNTPLYQGGVNVNRVTPGFEKTFFNGQASFELRTPFATTLDSDISNDPGITNTSNAEFGNITMYFKALLWSNDTLAISSGTGLTIPTASDFTIRDSFTGQKLVNVDNEAVHLLPFVGFVSTPSERLFFQGLAQFDVDVNGNPVSATSFDNGLPTGSLFGLGHGQDKTFAFLSLSAGYWVYLNDNRNGWITAVAPTFEYHLNQSLSDGDRIQGLAGNTYWDFGAPSSFSQSNAVLGMTTVLKNEATLTIGYATPLGGGDQQYDGELRVMFNWYFGDGLNRLSRVQF